ncbi:hypothetical protein [Pseudomonas frederiksbergensis]|uniref:hypothetical protein n=1 Tax=Pseudomonas frederiksbergensis TaxID=104087 RepID=UPI000F4AA11D|nr:hypothetical protein [Pseudomonas frederiksbergensis]RON46990.1 hypothetical protein BK667_22355 [Pseudomonas frederiksbergensis]
MTDSSTKKAEVADRGTLDYGFGVAGKVYFYDNGPERSPLQPRAVCVLKNGKILCTAVSEVAGDIWLIMLDSSGVLDPEFGRGGMSKVNISDYFPNVSGVDPSSVTVDAERKRIILGFEVVTRFETYPGLVSFSLKGDIDVGFGQNGVMVYDFFSLAQKNAQKSSRSNVEDAALADQVLTPTLGRFPGGIHLLDDGGVMLLFTHRWFSYWELTVLAKIKVDGGLDDSWADSGFRVIERDGQPVGAESLVSQGEKFLVAATTSLTYRHGWFITRYDKNGALDRTFAVDGYFDGSPSIKAVVLDRRARSELFIVGTSANAAEQTLFLMLQRRGIDGQEDHHFGEGGWGGAIDDMDSAHTKVWAAALYDPGNTVVVAGSTQSSRSGSNVFIASLEQDMGWDGAFGNGGRAVFAGEGIVHGLSVQSDRKVLFIYKMDNSAGSALVRLHG